MGTRSLTREWIKAHKNHPHKDWCLICPFFRDKNGRGVTHTGDRHYAHTEMCQLAHGPAPTPEHGCAHSCGNGHLGCANPNHLSWKTQAENLEDCRAHGTQPKNRVGNQGHFSPEQVAEIRRLLHTETQISIAHRYAVTESTISDIARGRYYSRPSKLKHWTPEEDEKIRDCIRRGLNFPQMAKEIGRSLGGTTGRAYRIGLSSGVPVPQSKMFQYALWRCDMENERSRLSLIQEAVLAALGCTKIDYQSPKKMDEGASQIAAFVEDILIRSEHARAEAINGLFSNASATIGHGWPPKSADF